MYRNTNKHSDSWQTVVMQAFVSFCHDISVGVWCGCGLGAVTLFPAASLWNCLRAATLIMTRSRAVQQTRYF